ncbi:MAG TPA: GNAT family N-acetyltransferase [Gemmatimonadales bacterium]|nr:GNAT family N-acetyltransferase [Gemmatimonadales bacterium]
MSLRLRLMTPDDIPVGMHLKDLAQWNQTVADWERFLALSPDGCFAAECDGRVVGTSTAIVYEGRFGWIGMVIVDPGYRGQGIGRALLERAIQYVESQRIPVAKLDATPQGRPLYQTLGFVDEYAIERWVLHRPSLGRRQAQQQPSEIAVDVLQLDREVFGADRGALLRSLAESAPELALVERRGGMVVGYAFGRRGSLADHLGPWVARDERAAARLLGEFLERTGRDLVFVDAVTQNPWGLPLVTKCGFQFSRPLTRMVRGSNNYPGRPTLQCAVLGPEFG